MPGRNSIRLLLICPAVNPKECKETPSDICRQRVWTSKLSNSAPVIVSMTNCCWSQQNVVLASNALNSTVNFATFFRHLFRLEYYLILDDTNLLFSVDGNEARTKYRDALTCRIVDVFRALSCAEWPCNRLQIAGSTHLSLSYW